MVLRTPRGVLATSRNCGFSNDFQERVSAAVGFANSITMHTTVFEAGAEADRQTTAAGAVTTADRVAYRAGSIIDTNCGSGGLGPDTNCGSDGLGPDGSRAPRKPR